MDIEILAVATVLKETAKTDYLVPYIKMKEKEPKWDGYICVYNHASKNEQHCGEDLYDRVSIQIKGIGSENFSKETIKYPVYVNDLENYLKDRGIIFFVVHVNQDGEGKIYYNKLLPFDIKRILNEIGKQKQKSITLKAFPSDKSSITDEFLNFINDSQKQLPVISGKLITYDDIIKDDNIKELRLSYKTINTRVNPIDYYLHHESYLYVIDDGIEYPLEHLEKAQSITVTVPIPIYCQGKHIYSDFKVIESNEAKIFEIGKSTKFLYNKNNKLVEFKFSINGTLSERITDLEFFLKIIEIDYFEVNGEKAYLSLTEEDKKKFQLDMYRLHLKELKQIENVLRVLKVEVDLDYDSLTDYDIQSLKTLIVAFDKNKPVSLCVENESIGFYKVANLKFLLFVEKEPDVQQYRLHNFFSYPLTYLFKLETGEEILTSQFLILKKDHFKTLCNIDYESMLKNIKKIPFSKIYSEQLTLLLLEMISAYDEKEPRDQNLLKYTKEFAYWLYNEDKFYEKEILLLNYLQIIKRERNLNKDEIRQLYKIVESGSIREDILVAAYLLLDDQIGAKAHFDNLEENRKEDLKKYPIWHFWKNSE